MNNPIKSYFKIKKLFSGDIYANLDSIESDEEEEIENLMNGSDTEFVTEGETVTSIYDLYE